MVGTVLTERGLVSLWLLVTRLPDRAGPRVVRALSCRAVRSRGVHLAKVWGRTHPSGCAVVPRLVAPCRGIVRQRDAACTTTRGLSVLEQGRRGPRVRPL
ncbi:hypothetical protein GCM10010174_60980 [Kutzneria viridogrisea]